MRTKQLCDQLVSGICDSKMVMREGVYQKYLCHVPFKDTLVKLCTNTGVSVKPMGFHNVTVQYREQCKELPIYVMKNEGPTLSD